MNGNKIIGILNGNHAHRFFGINIRSMSHTRLLHHVNLRAKENIFETDVHQRFSCLPPFRLVYMYSLLGLNVPTIIEEDITVIWPNLGSPRSLEKPLHDNFQKFPSFHYSCFAWAEPLWWIPSLSLSLPFSQN